MKLKSERRISSQEQAPKSCGALVKTKIKGSNRSRNGCNACKIRKIKCDEAKPKCSRCKNKGAGCIYELFVHFRDDYERKGKSFGREGVWSKTGAIANGTTDMMSSLKNATYSSIQNLHAIKFINYSVKCFGLSLEYPLQASIVPVDAFDGVPDQADTLFALSYYLDFISPIFDPVGLKKMSLKYLNLAVEVELGLSLSTLIQYSQAHTHVFYLMLALGCIYLSRLENSSYDWLGKSHEFKKLGMSAVKEYLASAGELELLTVSHLLSFVLLMLYELADNCNKEWITYLVASRKLLFSPNFVKPQSQVEKSLLKFSVELLTYQDTMGRTACRDKNSFVLPEEEVVTELEPAKLTVSWMGCNNKLVQAISDITDLSFQRSGNGISNNNYKKLCDNIRQRLLSMDLQIELEQLFFLKAEKSKDFVPLNGTLLDPSVNVEELCFLLACEAKRLATMVYLECSLLNKVPKDLTIQRLVKDVFRLLEFVIIQNSFKWSATLLWPLFVASAEISVRSPICEKLRYSTMAMLDCIELRSLGNVSMTRDIIAGIWNSRDMEIGEERKIRSLHSKSLVGFKNDWEVFVADESYKISLG